MDIKKLEKIAKLVLVQVKQNQIALVCGVSESSISQIISSKEYKEVEQVMLVEKAEQMSLLDEGWDGVEALGVKRVLQELQQNPDPEFALKAAVVANKAIRRENSSFKNKPIAADQGVRATIHLNPVFVDKMQNNLTIQVGGNESLDLVPKASDFLPASDVNELLGKRDDGSSATEKSLFNVEKSIGNPDVKGLDEFPEYDENESLSLSESGNEK